MDNPIDIAIKIAGSQTELARLSGLTQAAISILKNGRDGSPVIPRFETAQRLSKAVSYQIEWHEFMARGVSSEQGREPTPENTSPDGNPNANAAV